VILKDITLSFINGVCGISLAYFAHTPVLTPASGWGESMTC
jgi:hypothetical protein